MSDNTPDDSRANDYEGTAKWTYNKVNPDSTTQLEGTDDDEEYTFKSCEPDTDWGKISARTIKSSA